LGAAAERQAWSAAKLQLHCDPSLSHFESAVRTAFTEDHSPYAKLVATQLIGLDWAVPDFSTLCRR
jgi:hypothetical protein